MQTVRPYVGAVKRVYLYIVSQSYQVGCCLLPAAFPQGGASIEIQVARWSCATQDLPLFEFFRGLPGRGPKCPVRSRQHLGSGRGPALQI